MRIVVIHHSADYDGILCREIARKFLPNAELIGWDFADKPLEIPKCDVLYVMDLPLDAPFGFKWNFEHHSWRYMSAQVYWIDHHKSSIESHPKDIPGYRIDGVAACRLAWQWFTQRGRDIGGAEFFAESSKQDFVDRKVSEPLAVRLAGEYDVWDHRGDGDLEFQFGLRLVDTGSDFWEALLQTDSVGDKAVLDTVEHGKILMKYQSRVDADICRDKSFLVEFEGLKFLALNHARFNSNTFKALDNPKTGHDALLGFSHNGKRWTISLYHSAHRKDLDLSLIAAKRGGGGHRGACGFQADQLPFLDQPQAHSVPEPATKIHVIPIGDKEIHAAQESCFCHPTKTDGNVWTHNAKDCREAKERISGKKCSDGWILILEPT